MDAIQLDESFDDKRLVRACTSEGKVRALRFPRGMRNRGVKDPEVMSRFIPLGRPILTVDVGFASDHVNDLPDQHPGILIVALEDDAVQTMTSRLASRMLDDLKSDIPGWEGLDLSNSIILVKPSNIEVSRCDSHTLVRDRAIDRSADGWQAELCDQITSNAE